jgi:NAD(P) transhydrogenase subunit alpha
MAVRIAVPRESAAGERRVALVPEVASRLARSGAEVAVERGAGDSAGYPDASYSDAGAKIADDRTQLLSTADLILKVQTPSAEEVDAARSGAVVVGFLAPSRALDSVRRMRDRGLTAFALELLPRITRAQSMDALSSQATAAGYEAAIIGAELAPRFLPMLTTAAGTIRPAKVLVLGAGVAGLMSIATARRLGAVVEAYDVRRAAGEQVRSLGAKFLELQIDAEAAGGYARELTADEKQQEQRMVADAVAQANVVITTAAIPGRPAPRLVSREMVERMQPGAVLVDLAAETGGNCELTRPGERVDHRGVRIEGPLNLPSRLAFHASQMYARNLLAFLGLLIDKEGRLVTDYSDEILAASLLVKGGEVVHAPTRALLSPPGAPSGGRPP